MTESQLYTEALALLDSLIATPSPSRSEGATAELLERWLHDHGCDAQRVGNNVYAVAAGYDPSRPTVMLNAHHDTVKPSPSYTRDPYEAAHIDGKVYGLGSNDDGGSLVALAATYLMHKDDDAPYNLLLALTAEEEVGGEGGMRALLPELERRGYRIDMGIVGEPTQMQPAIAERGLIVLDCVAHGVTGHAARNEGVNALYKALDDIETLRGLRFPRESATLGPIKVTVTQIEAGRQHNVVPETCRYVVDVRTTDAYTNEETEAYIASKVESDVKARSYRIRASVIDAAHPLVAATTALGKTPFVSPTTSDMSTMPHIPTLKIGPGDSARSHSADEYIHEHEIADGIATYSKILTNLKTLL